MAKYGEVSISLYEREKEREKERKRERNASIFTGH